MKQFGLLGYPLGHSFSRAFFTDKFAREGIDAEYLNFELPDIAALPALIAEHPALCGFNVTIPYKQAVIPYLDDLSSEASAIGAVNTVKIDGNRLIGHNTDIIGFRDSLRPLLQPHHTRALVLGTGGASRAVVHALDTLGITWRYVSRKGSFSYSALTPAILASYTLIINCTPLGMSPNIDNCPDIPYEALTPRHLLFDLVYNPEETLFLRRGRERGAVTKNGLEMLHLQALAAWRIWNSDNNNNK